MARRRYQDDYFDWSAYHAAERNAIARKYGGVIDDIKEIFFSLDDQRLGQVFREYKRKHNTSAKQHYEKWKSGNVQMSGKVAERLLDILPKHLPFETKYALVRTMWRDRPKQKVRLTVSPYVEASLVVHQLLDLIRHTTRQGIPEAISARLEWLSSADGVAAERLVCLLYEREEADVVSALADNLVQIQRAMGSATKANARGTCVLELPGVTVEISIDPRQRNLTMTSDHGPEKQPSRDLVSKPSETRDVAPIRDAHELLADALKHISPEKKAEIAAKALEEAYQLDTKRKHLEHDRRVASDIACESAHYAEQAEKNPNTVIDYRREHETADGGRVKVEVRSKDGFCFIATACFESYDHPTVKDLRAFRDEVLGSSMFGRLFIRFYYRVGPVCGRLVASSSATKAACRAALTTLSRMIQRTRNPM